MRSKRDLKLNWNQNLKQALVFAAVLGFGMAAQAGRYIPTDTLKSEWLQKHFEKSQQIKASQGIDKMCATGSALYDLVFEPHEVGSMEDYLKATYTLVDVPLEKYVASLPPGKTKITNMSTRPSMPLTAENANRIVSRVFDSEELKQDFTSRLEEFDGKKVLMHTDLIYRRRVNPGDPILDNFIRAYVVLDIENSQAMVVSSGDCQF